MKTFFDSSALAKRYIAEPGSQSVDDICQKTDQLAICIICVPEIISALNRRVREKTISKSDYEKAKTQLLNDVRDMDVIYLTEDVIPYAVMLMESNTLRAMDALHIAAAKTWGCDLFVTADKEQAAAARRAGLKQSIV